MTEPQSVSLSSSTPQYTQVASALHWLIALLVVLNLGTGLTFRNFEPAVLRQILLVHRSTGLIILALVAIRVIWRLSHAPPAFSRQLPYIERAAAVAVHAGLYGAMAIVPLSGWTTASAAAAQSGQSLSWFGLPFPLLPLAALSEDQLENLKNIAAYVHLYSAWVFIGLLTVHIAAVAKHIFYDHDAILRRIAIFRR